MKFSLVNDDDSVGNSNEEIVNESTNDNSENDSNDTEIESNEENEQEQDESSNDVEESLDDGSEVEQDEDDDEYEYINLEDEEALLNYVRGNEELLSKLDNKDLPQDVKRYLKFKEETNGRSFSDFLEYQEDFSEMSSEDKVKRYLAEQNPDFTKSEIEDEYNDRFSFDEYLDDESEIKRKQRGLKRIVNEASDYLEEQKEKWGEPLGSDESNIPDEYVNSKKELEEIRQQEADTLFDNNDKSQYFMEQTQELFNDDFKGFEFQIGDETYSHEITNSKEVIEKQSDPINFFGKFVDEDGYIKDIKGYHKALYVAMNYESIMKNVRDTAVSKYIENDAKASKNIDMGKARRSPESIKSGTKFKIVE